MRRNANGSLTTAAAAAVALGLASCTTPVSSSPPTPPPSSAPASGFPTPTATTSSPSFPADWPVPDRALSPGVVAVTDVTRLCPHVDPALEQARPSSADKAKVYAAYHLAYPQPPGKYELDHVIPIELGGAPNNPANEFPELNDTPDPAAIARWHLSPGFVHNSKDIVEDAAHELVCAGKITLAQAQDAMLADWRAAYARFVGAPPQS